MWFRLGLDAPFAYNIEKALEEHPGWVRNQLQRKDEPEVLNFFIYGASTFVGLYAAQMVRTSAEMSGKEVRLFGAASKARWEMLRSAPYRYIYLVDYREKDWPKQIQELSGGGMHFAYDRISEGSSAECVSSTLATNGKVVIVRWRAGGAWEAGSLPVELIYGAVWEDLGEEVQYQGLTVKKSPAARDFAVQFYKWLSERVRTALKPNPVRLMPGGLGRVVADGFRLLGPEKMEERKIKRMEE
ncbi:uncharacterized protein BDR25DRAFT_306912 [Lindgomyces ingoldianus]|uniref:Uncharacterized protein n=1 Tax=Lindgomyces ingoldianus TaxID=673940 RepID=A0ACB6QG26_9PLEO|nr:uncharacterized protein BDR25DRAFT_306912 [Lindgomyces ingoldianus]KAF2465067.1 hypothetical protein BDR25DRAFT_306912 [Lindgomyces ingoldianus]